MSSSDIATTAARLLNGRVAGGSEASCRDAIVTCGGLGARRGRCELDQQPWALGARSTGGASSCPCPDCTVTHHCLGTRRLRIGAG